MSDSRLTGEYHADVNLLLEQIRDLTLYRSVERQEWMEYTDKLKAENESLRAALKDAEYRADQGKVWNGMGWTYTGLSAHGQQKVLDILRAAISSPENH